MDVTHPLSSGIEATHRLTAQTEAINEYRRDADLHYKCNLTLIGSTLQPCVYLGT